MEYIPRALETLVDVTAKEYSVLLVTGPRQVGKSTLLEHVIEQTGRSVNSVTLDDMTERALASSDPAMFLQIHEPPVLIDEVQYAPELFSQIKMLVDQGAPAGSFWLTGSQQFRLMELAGESLAGRVAILPLSSLTQGETERCPAAPFSLDLSYWKYRQRQVSSKGVLELFEAMRQGAMPAVDAGRYSNLDIFYGSYLQTYIERDVRRLLGNIDALQFVDFMRAVAARCSQMLNVASIAGDVGIRPDKAKAWLAVLEKSGIIFYLHPYSNNQLKRTVKAPKLYCHDCGLVAYLTKWMSAATMEAGAMAGAFFENYVISEIWKSFLNAGMDAPLYYYRDHDGREIDLVVEADGVLHPVEIKKTASPNRSMVRNFIALDRATLPRGRGAVVCASEKFTALDSETLVIPACLL
ncbi:ATP-binding protein [Adlercreutzia sp. R25]|uniref:ATP-binding protein n=1 Tax=Adlercreutzia shanghongiae TaxID=3111773 RepID=A0ABU6IXR9_9ACTN|nr:MULTISPECIES: ATP-binding protein [unclassified Adlercreutzia]MEC4271651.1 ATP-binding protein [Adlercreutzia sp. R25]MEC4294657.1 ATP-binding protein [Adlercreutzia sp. R22]